MEMEVTRRNQIQSVLGTFLDSMKANTGRAYRKDIEDFMTGSALNLKGAVAYFDGLSREGYSSSTLERKRAALSKFFSILEENGLIEKNPFKTETFRLSMKKTTQTAQKQTVRKSAKPQAHHLSEEDLQKMLSLCDTTLTGIRNRVILLLGAREGLRRSEISEITWSDISEEPEGKTLTIRGSKSGKTEPVKLFRGVYTVLMELREAYQAYGITSDFIVVSLSPNRRGERLSGISINEIVKTLAKEANVLNAGEITAHDLRHTAAVSMHGEGVPVSSISRMLRHKDIKVTMVYLETLGLHEDKSLNRLDW